MYNLFIFKTNSIRGVNYGIGTYLNQLINCLMEYEDIFIYIVNYCSVLHKELCCYNKSPRLIEINIPSTILSYEVEIWKNKYAARIIDIITVFINKANNVVFQVNYPAALQLVKQLKSRFHFPVISTVHLANWQIEFDGNKQQFIKYWSNRKEVYYYKLKHIDEELDLYRISDRIITVTNYMKEFINTFYNIPNERITTIQNGIKSKINIAIKQEEKKQLKQELGFNVAERIILFVGRLDPNKGLPFLIESFKDVVTQNAKSRLVIIGGDSGPVKISEYLTHCLNIWSKVTFTGFLDHEMILKYYKIADIGIIPSIYDHCPYVLLEMIDHNIPMIISNTEGLNELLSNDQSIYLTPTCDNEGNISLNKNEITNAILTLLRDKRKVKNITKNYKELLLNKYSADRMGNEMYNVIRGISLNPVIDHD